MPCLVFLVLVTYVFWWFIMYQVNTLHADFHLILITCARGWRYCFSFPGEWSETESRQINFPRLHRRWAARQADNRPQAFGYDLIQSVLNILGFHTEFLYLLIFISNPHINTCYPFVIICRHVQNIQKFESPHTHAPSWGPTRWQMLCLLFSYCK